MYLLDASRSQSDTGEYTMVEMTESLDEFMGQVDMSALEEASAWDVDDPESIAIGADLAAEARQELRMDSLFGRGGNPEEWYRKRWRMPS